MNIFNGHENKSPKALAKELGISDLSVIKNAGRNIKKTLENPKMAEGIEDTIIAENSIKNISTKNFTFQDLEEGMTLRGEERGVVSIFVIRDDKNILIKNDSDIWRDIKDFQRIKNNLSINIEELDWKSDDRRVSLEEIENIYNSIPEDLLKNCKYIRYNHGNDFTTIFKKVVKNSGVGYTVTTNSDDEYWEDNSVIGNFTIHKIYLAQYQIKKQENQEIKQITSLDDIPIGTEIIDINHIKPLPKIRTVDNIGADSIFTSDKDDVTVRHGESFNVIQGINIINGNCYYLCGSQDIDLNDEKLWADNCYFVDLREKMKINLFDENALGEIVNLDNNTISVSYNGKVININFSFLGTKFSVYSPDLREVNKKTFEELGIPINILNDDNYWEKINDISDLEVGMKIRLQNGDGGTITKINGNNIVGIYVNNSNGNSYMKNCSNFDILKDETSININGLKQEELDDDNFWENLAIVNQDFIRSGTRVRKKGKLGIIINNNNILSIKYTNPNGDSYIDKNLINIEVFKKDIEEETIRKIKESLQIK